MSLSILFSFACTIFVLISSPGPNVLLVIRNARSGIRSAARTIVGGSLSATLLLIIALCSITLIWNINENVLEIGKLIGGLYLIWLGYNTHKENMDNTTVAHNSFWLAFITGLSNPKDIIFFLAFLPNFLVFSDSMLKQSVYLILIWLSIDFIIMLFYAEFAKQLFRLQWFQLILYYLSSVVLILLGSFSIISSLTSL